MGFLTPTPAICSKCGQPFSHGCVVTNICPDCEIEKNTIAITCSQCGMAPCNKEHATEECIIYLQNARAEAEAEYECTEFLLVRYKRWVKELRDEILTSKGALMGQAATPLIIAALDKAYALNYEKIDRLITDEAEAKHEKVGASKSVSIQEGVLLEVVTVTPGSERARLTAVGHWWERFGHPDSPQCITCRGPCTAAPEEWKEWEKWARGQKGKS